MIFSSENLPRRPNIVLFVCGQNRWRGGNRMCSSGISVHGMLTGEHDRHSERHSSDKSKAWLRTRCNIVFEKGANVTTFVVLNDCQHASRVRASMIL